MIVCADEGGWFGGNRDDGVLSDVEPNGETQEAPLKKIQTRRSRTVPLETKRTNKIAEKKSVRSQEKGKHRLVKPDAKSTDGK